jgi:hypothetical protein
MLFGSGRKRIRGTNKRLEGSPKTKGMTKAIPPLAPEPVPIAQTMELR